MYKIVTLAVLAGIALGVAAGFSFGSKELTGMFSGMVALAFIVAPAAVVYASEKKKWHTTQ
ncbi:hypothetical protein [Sporosarcina ureae]|uniref:hypothetical protein n=1 Tax=Sporosarcina ureae TaxID=1571 RepID=UPI0009DC7AD9|nr:hypothetical protein [Sporosarcina ureae]ARF17004.1 hypothetical protein SporoP17a_06740 [Sporosarcina ureae]